MDSTLELPSYFTTWNNLVHLSIIQHTSACNDNYHGIHCDHNKCQHLRAQQQWPYHPCAWWRRPCHLVAVKICVVLGTPNNCWICFVVVESTSASIVEFVFMFFIGGCWADNGNLIPLLYNIQWNCFFVTHMGVKKVKITEIQFYYTSYNGVVFLLLLWCNNTILFYKCATESCFH